MLHSVAEAEAEILRRVPLLPTEDCPLAQAGGRVLRSPLRADRDVPPFDRVTMDGYAVRAAALEAGVRRLQVVGTQAAGMIPLTLHGDDTCIEIATGAVLPGGSDCVVPYEETTREGVTVTVLPTAGVRAGSNLHRRGSDHRAGAELVPAGLRLTSRELAVAASIGAGTLRVSLCPAVAVVSTGDELVDVSAPAVAPHQIRRSNDQALRSGLHEAGFPRVECFHFRDVRSDILEGMRHILLRFDAVVITGGVSKGKFDHLPSVLTELAVHHRIHGVAQRPGKPFWFGLTSRGTPVFALPGNPVSTTVCFRRYVVPALRRMTGAPADRLRHAVLAEPVTLRAPLAAFVPVRLESGADGRCLAHPHATNTSGDFTSLVGTDGFVELPAGPGEYPAGRAVVVWSW